jgi:hypothetical protein
MIKKSERPTMLFPLLLALGMAFFILACKFEKQKISAQEVEYIRTITERADKIVTPLGITNPDKARLVRDIIVQQYRDLRVVHNARDAQIKNIEEQTDGNKDAASALIKKIWEEANSRQDKLHEVYITKLSEELSLEQVNQVKDGMTYGAYPITYKNYIAMLPDLNEEQKAQIKIWLIDAREQAMDAGSSEEKLAWFGKYKGKITNYLSSAGYELKVAEEAWAKRRESQATVDSIMKNLTLPDPAKASRVRDIMEHQYKSLREIHDKRDAEVEAAEKLAEENKKLSDEGIITAWADAKVKLTALHSQYLSKLSAELTPEQVIIVKDGMTDNGLKKDYSRFLAMLPELTEEEKGVIMKHLIEARENAMDSGSPKEVRQWFAKYRGRANNYLSDAGYDLRKATEYLKNKQRITAQAKAEK